MVTDNAAVFHSKEFQNWSRERGIQNVTGAPYHRMLQTFKRALQKAHDHPVRALQEFLMLYRRTPLECGLSPSELLNNRQIRGKLDALIPQPNVRKPVIHDPKVQQRAERKMSRLRSSGRCYLRQGEGRKAQLAPGTIQKQQGPQTYIVTKDSDGTAYKKHFDQIRSRRPNEETTTPIRTTLAPRNLLTPVSFRSSSQRHHSFTTGSVRSSTPASATATPTTTAISRYSDLLSLFESFFGLPVKYCYNFRQGRQDPLKRENKLANKRWRKYRASLKV